MKIGLSFGRCVRDIVMDKVALSEVLVIVSRTRMETIDHVEGVVDTYMYRREYLHGLDRDKCMAVAAALFKSGKLHQPRLQGAFTGSAVAEDYVWMDAVPTVHEDNEVVRKAWNSYQMALKLAAERVPDQIDRYVPEIRDNF